MPSIEIHSSDLQQVDMIVSAVRVSVAALPTEARLVLAIELIRLMKPELDELRRQGAADAAIRREVPDA